MRTWAGLLIAIMGCGGCGASGTDGTSEASVLAAETDGLIPGRATEDDVKHKRHRAVASLRRFKDDVREVRAGMECGIRVDGFDDVKPGDVLEAYEVVETARTL